MNTRKLTVIFLMVATIWLIAWDTYAYVTAGSQATISRVLLDTSWTHPCLPLFAGGLVAHLFWPGGTPVAPKWGAGLGGAVLLASEAVFTLAHLSVFPLLALVLGFFLGRVLVPQARKAAELI